MTLAGAVKVAAGNFSRLFISPPKYLAFFPEVFYLTIPVFTVRLLKEISLGGITIDEEIGVDGPGCGPEINGGIIATIGSITGAKKDRYPSARFLDVGNSAGIKLVQIKCGDPAAGAVLHSIVAAFSGPDLQSRVGTSYGFNYDVDLALPSNLKTSPLALVLPFEEVLQAFPKFQDSKSFSGQVLLFIISAWDSKAVNEAIRGLADALDRIKDTGPTCWLLQFNDYMVPGTNQWSQKLVFVIKIDGFLEGAQIMAE